MTIAVKRQFQAAETDLHENVVRWPVTRERFLIALFSEPYRNGENRPSLPAPSALGI
jgi:hypothetical protein